MPPKVRISREMVTDASVEIIRKSGHESLNARTLAEYLNCSTQPVLYNFRTVDEIRAAAYEAADAYHTAYIMRKEADQNPLLALGLHYVRFGYEEKNLFRFLFQTNKFGGMDVASLMNNPEFSGIAGVMAAGLGCGEKEARDMFLTFFCAAHGLASLLANNAMAYDEAQSRKTLEDVFFGMIAVRKCQNHQMNGD